MYLVFKKKITRYTKGKGVKPQFEETASIRTRCRYDIDVEFPYKKFKMIVINVSILMEK